MTRILVAVIALTAFAAIGMATKCNIVAEPCDNTWNSRQNQTFAFLGVGGAYVQLVSYWQTQHACISNNVTDATLTGLGASYNICQEPSSIWTYGPGDIKTYVFYNTSSGQCISLVPRVKVPGKYVLGFRPCCGKTMKNTNCTLRERSAQMWLEAPTAADPYNRINSLFTSPQAPTGYCFTRVGSC